MSKKTKRLYGRMQHGIEKKRKLVESLEEKRDASEKDVETKTSSNSKASNEGKKTRK